MIQKRLDRAAICASRSPAEAQAGMDRQQREYFLREQMRAIQKELGEGSAEETLANELRQKIEAAGMPDEVQDKGAGAGRAPGAAASVFARDRRDPLLSRVADRAALGDRNAKTGSI